MPELPEVETLRLQFSTILIGLKIKDIQIFKSKSFIGDIKQVIGGKIEGVRRFAKILVVDLSNGLSLAIHLKMSGQLILRQNRQLKYISRHSRVVNNLPNKHTRVIINFTNGDRLFFNDQRIFGWIRIVRNNPINSRSSGIHDAVIPIRSGTASGQLSNKPIKDKIQNINDLIKNLGPEPLNITNKKFYQILQTSKRPIKLVLMDQEKIGGVGNIYANDALFLAGIHPRTPANKLSDGQMVKLFDKLLQVLKDGIKWGGASQNNFLDAYGRKGEMQKHFLVYDREGKSCPNICGEKIKRIKLGGRGTFYCSKCQRTGK